MESTSQALDGSVGFGLVGRRPSGSILPPSPTKSASSPTKSPSSSPKAATGRTVPNHLEGARVKPIIKANIQLSDAHPFKFRVFYEFQEPGGNTRVFPDMAQGTDARRRSSHDQRVHGSLLDLHFQRPENAEPDRLDNTLQDVELPDWKKEYIRKRVHTRICALTTELLESMPDDAKAFLMTVLEKGGAVKVNGKNELPKPTDKPNGSGSYVLSSLKASDEKKHYLQKVHPLISKAINLLVEHAPEDIDQFLYDALAGGHLDV